MLICNSEMRVGTQCKQSARLNLPKTLREPCVAWLTYIRLAEQVNKYGGMGWVQNLSDDVWMELEEISCN